MKFRLENNTGRGTRVIVDNKHFKTVPKSLSKAVNYKTIEKLGINGKRLSPIERKLLAQFAAFENWKAKLYIKERYVYDLINNAVPISKRKVITRTSERLELVLDNQIKITVPDKVYHSLSLSETISHSNF